jgi:hypothetical protein
MAKTKTEKADKKAKSNPKKAAIAAAQEAENLKKKKTAQKKQVSESEVCI